MKTVQQNETGRYWIVAGKIVIARHPAMAKRFAKLRGVKGPLSQLNARLANPDEISRFISEHPERVAANDKARGEYEARERLNKAAPQMLTALQDLIEGNQLLPGYHYDQVRAAIAQATS